MFARRSILSLLSAGLAASIAATLSAQPCGGSFAALDAASTTLNGSAIFIEEGLRLTTTTSGQAGSAWYSAAKPVVADGFVTTFTFRIQGTADGFAFVIQDEGLSALGGDGSSMGYADGPGITRSVAIEFDTFGFSDEFETDHVSIQTRCGGVNSTGDDASIAHVNLNNFQINLDDGEDHECTITYDQGRFRIELDGFVILDDVPFSFSSCDGDEESIVTEGGCAFVGFTAATGGAVADQIILSWDFQDEVICVTTGITQFVFDQNVTEGDRLELHFEASGTQPHSFVWEFNSQVIQDEGPFSGSNTNTLVIDHVGREHAGHWVYIVNNECSSSASGFQINVIPLCPADFNGDGFRNPDDLADFITCFFLDVQFPGFCPAADFNADEFRNPDDLADFITVFFTSNC